MRTLAPQTSADSDRMFALLSTVNHLLQEHYEMREGEGDRVAIELENRASVEQKGCYTASFFADDNDTGPYSPVALVTVERATWEEALTISLYRAVTL